MGVVHIGSTKYNNEFRPAQNLSDLLGTFGEKITVETIFYYEDIQWALEGDDIIVHPDPAGLAGTFTNRQELVFCPSRPNAFGNYKVGDKMNLQGSAAGNNNGGSGFTVTEIISGNLIRCAGATFTPEVLPFGAGAYISNITPMNGVKWAYNIIQGAANYNSLIDGELQQLKTAAANANSATVVNMFFNGMLSYQIGGATLQGVSFTNERQTFKLIHTTFVTPFFLASQWAQLVGGVQPPAYFAGGNCPNYAFKLDLLRALNNPNSLASISVNNPANLGWFNENFNGNPTNYEISGGYTIEKVSDGSIIPRLIFDEELELTITISNFTDSPFSSGNTKYCINFCYLPENETLYQGNGRTLAQNFVFDRKFSTVGAAVANGDNFGTGYQVIKNVVATELSPDQIEIVARVELGAIAKSIIQQGDFSRYLIWVTTEDHSLADTLSDKVAILVQVDEFDVVTTVSDLIKCETFFIQHPKTDTSDEIVDNVEVFPVDDLAARSNFYIDLASYPTDGIKIKKIRPKILLRKAGNADIILDDFLLDVSNYPLVGLAQNIAFTQDRIFKIPAGEVRKVITIARDYTADADNGFTNWYINWPFMIRWEYYLQLLNLISPIPADLVDITKPFNGLNNFWHRFTLLTGWSLKYEIDFTFQQKGDQASQSFTKTINSYDFEEGPNYDSNSITFWDKDTNVELIDTGQKFFQGYKPTRIEAVFNKINGQLPDVEDVVIVLWMEPLEAGGVGIARRISSKYVLDNQSWFLSVDGSGLVEVTNPNPGEYKGVALINPDAIPDYEDFRFYARLYDNTERDCMVIRLDVTIDAVPGEDVLLLSIKITSGALLINWGNGKTTIVNSSAAIQSIFMPLGDGNITPAGIYDITICGAVENISSFEAKVSPGAGPITKFITDADLTRLESDLANYITFGLYSSKIGNGDVVVPVSSKDITTLRFRGSDQTGLAAPFNTTLTTLDISNLSGNATSFDLERFNALTSVVFNPGMDVLSSFTVLNNEALDFVFNFGTELFPQNIIYRCVGGVASPITTATLDAILFLILNNGDAYQTRTAGPKTLTINGTNAAPSGTLVAPPGYVQADGVTAGNNGSPTTGKHAAYILLNQNVDFTTTKRYNWSAINMN